MCGGRESQTVQERAAAPPDKDTRHNVHGNKSSGFIYIAAYIFRCKDASSLDVEKLHAIEHDVREREWVYISAAGAGAVRLLPLFTIMSAWTSSYKMPSSATELIGFYLISATY